MIFPTRAAALSWTWMLLAGCLAAQASELPRKDASALARSIDKALGERLAGEKVKPTGLADDAEFLRRAYLDLTGVIPPVDKVRAFLDSKEPNRRARLIDELLASSDYGRHMGDLWHNLLMEQRDLLTRGLQTEPLAKWLAEHFNRNTPWDRLVSDLLTSTGTQQENGATTFFLAHRSPDRLTDPVCRVFLGIQLQCAKCHNHPYTGWKRTEYWGMAAFFAKVDDGAPKKLGKAGTPPRVHEAGTVVRKRLPDSALKTTPRFLGGETPPLGSMEPYRPVLARWLTSAKNPYFARAMVNRLWAQLFGRGLVNPVDNLHDDNPPSHPKLFDALTREFIDGGFDVKHLVRAICNSQAYQRASTPAGQPAASEALYASIAIRPLTPEQLYDSLARVLGTPGNPKKRARTRGGKLKGAPAGSRAAFVDFFRPGDGADPNDYPAGIPQVLRLMNSDWMSRTGVVVRQAVKLDQPAARNIEALFLATLARRPGGAESRRLTHYLQDNADQPAKAYGDILWALLNSSEFRLNH